MKTKLYNNDNLKQEDITETIVRARALMINSNDEVLMGYCKKTYQLPGGHLEGNESIEEGLKREILEETGISLNNLKTTPFYVVRYYNKDYPKIGKNRCTELYFHLIKTDEKYNLSNTNYDEYEKENDFELKYIKLEDLEGILLESIPDNPKNKIVVPELLEVINYYKNNREKI